VTHAGPRRVGWLVVALFIVGPGVAAQTGAPPSGDWPVYGGDSGHTRFSPLRAIHAGNVDQLEVAWTWSGANFGPRPEIRNQVTPLAIGGVLYATAGSRRSVVAIDGASGETLWMWRPAEDPRAERAPRPGSGRGVAYWEDAAADAGRPGGPADRRVLVMTPGYRLVALDARSGRPVESFGKDGVVDLAHWLRSDLDPAGRIGASSPPLVVGDVVVVGAAMEVGMRPRTVANIPGDVFGIDVRTGERLWTFHTVPLPNDPAYGTWDDGSAEYTGNAAVWAPISADAERGLVYLPVEAPTHDLYGGHRPGDNLYGTSLVALEAATGRRVWHRQIVHHDIWDFDNPTAPILADVTVDGRPREVVVQLTKQSFAYVFDRVTGDPVWPIEERPVPASDVPGERASSTQPFPTKPAPYDRQGVTLDDLIDFTPELRTEAEEIAASYRLGALFQPPSLADAADGTRGTLSLPGSLGGANWEGGALDPTTGWLYVASMTSPSVLALAPPDPERSEMDYVAAGRGGTRVQGLPIVRPPWGRITAIDLTTGEHRWWIANADTPEEVLRHPALEGIDLPRTGRQSRAGLLVTKTLLFAGEGFGGEPILRAHDKGTGEILAEVTLPASQTGLPLAYRAGGRQYLLVPIGGAGRPASFVALTLPE